MTKEEILAKGRADNKDNDPIEIAVSRRSIMFGTLVGIILCMALFFICWTYLTEHRDNRYFDKQ